MGLWEYGSQKFVNILFHILHYYYLLPPQSLLSEFSVIKKQPHQDGTAFQI